METLFNDSQNAARKELLMLILSVWLHHCNVLESIFLKRPNVNLLKVEDGYCISWDCLTPYNGECNKKVLFNYFDRMKDDLNSFVPYAKAHFQGLVDDCDNKLAGLNYNVAIIQDNFWNNAYGNNIWRQNAEFCRCARYNNEINRLLYKKDFYLWLLPQRVYIRKVYRRRGKLFIDFYCGT